MSCLFSRHLGLKETSAESQVTDQVKKLMSCALIRETEHQIAQISVFPHLQSRYIEELAHPLHLLIRDRMLDNYDRIVHITALDKIVVEKELYLVEEHECPAHTDLLRICYRRVPLCVLHPENP